MNQEKLPEITRGERKRIFSLFGEHVSKGQIKFLSAGHLDILESNRQGSGFDNAETGERFIDGFSSAGCFNVGRGNPEVVNALHEAIDHSDMGSTGLMSEHKINFACKLAEYSPKNLNKVTFAGSGAEAIEVALKLARAATGRNTIISMEKAYHGHSGFSLSANGKDYYKELFLPLMPGFMFVPFGNIEAIKKLADESVAAIILEPIQGEGGIHVASDAYLAELRNICDRFGIILIFDEIQTGFGRTGRLWASEFSGIVPDIMVLAKSIGGGVYPNGAIVFKDKGILEEYVEKNPSFHTSSGGGSDPGCIVSSKVLDYLIDNRIWNNAEKMGNLLIKGLNDLRKKHPGIIKDVRGRGMMVGIEYDQEYMGVLMADCLARKGMFAVYSGNAPHVMRFQLPITATEDDIKTTLEIISSAIGLMKIYLILFLPISWSAFGKKLLNNQNFLVAANNLMRVFEFGK